VLLILDASFGGDVAGRTLPQGRPRTGDGLSRAFLDRLVTRPGRFVLTSCDPNETAQEYAAEGRGIFGLVLEQALAEAGARAPDGRLRLADLAGYLAERVPPSSALLGQSQNPLLLGDRGEAAAVILSDRTRTVPPK
jgi:uncharacterized caspase-like protein